MSYIHIVNYTRKPVIVTIDNEPPITLPYSTGRKIEVKTGRHSIKTTKEDGTVLDSLSEETMARVHYFYKVKGKGWATVVDCSNLYGGGKVIQKIRVSSGPSSKPGTVVIDKTMKEKWTFLGVFDETNKRILVIPGDGFPHEVQPNDRVFMLLHKETSGSKRYISDGIAGWLPKTRR